MPGKRLFPVFSRACADFKLCYYLCPLWRKSTPEAPSNRARRARQIRSLSSPRSHVQLLTRTKNLLRLFHRLRRPANTNVCPVCLGCQALCLSSTSAPSKWLCARACTELHRPRSFAPRSQKLFLPDLPKGTKISNTNAARHRWLARNRNRPAIENVSDHPPPPRRRRRQKSPRASRTATKPTSITTAAAPRSVKSSPSRTCARRRG